MHTAMVDESDGIENFFWENQQWLISDIPGGDNSINVLLGGVAGEDNDKGTKVLVSGTSNSRNTLGGGVVMPIDATIGKKKSAATGVGGSGGSGGHEGGGGELDHEMQLSIERGRRKNMRNMFSSLQALIPHLPPKAHKSTVVEEAVIYIKSLQQTLNQLQKQKLERLHGMSNNMKFAGPSRLNKQNLALINTRESFMSDRGSSNNLTTLNSTSPSPSFSNIPRFPSAMNFETWFSPNVVLNICGAEAHISVNSFKKPGMLPMICSILDKNKLEVVSAQVFADNFRNTYMMQIRGNSTDYQLPEGFLIKEAFKQAAVEIMLWITNP